MIRLFICPECGWIRTVSRKSDVECFKCENVQMVPSRLEYAAYIRMSEQERRDYADSWMYIHNCSESSQ
ncbi:MAG: DNA-directed RNA polymerase subunit M [Clostridiales bacterium]|nr:DNA-directed RNA polymerase subunit M [Clostridiales bacterium]